MDENGTSAGLPTGFQASDIAGAIARLREHPEIISAVAGALSSSGGSGQGTAGPTEGEPIIESEGATAGFPIEKMAEAMTALTPILSELGGKSATEEIKGSREDHRHALLYALRPYLSRDRREMVDYILKFGRIGELLKKMK